MEKTIAVGIIGTGGMAASHADSYRKISGVEIATCFDISPARSKAFAEKHSIVHVATDVEDVLSRVDAISIVTPDRFHAPLTIQGLAAGKHTLCEKPLTLTLADAEEVAAAAREASERGIIHMVNFSYRSSAAFQEAISIAQSGALGNIRHVHSSYLQSWLNHNINSSTATDAGLWRLSTALGSQGVLGDLGCHLLDLTTACSDDLKAVRCELRTFPKPVDGIPSPSVNGRDLDANDTAIIEFELAGGGIGVCHTTRWATGNGNHIRLEVNGTEGALRFDLEEDPNVLHIWAADDDGAKKWIAKTLDKTPSNWERFIVSIRTGIQDQPDILRGARVQAYLEACERSASSKQWEQV